MGTSKNKQENLKPDLHIIRNLIAESNIDNALNILETINLPDDYRNEVIMLSSRFKELEKNDRIGTISYGEKDLFMNKIRKSLVELIREIEKERRPLEKTNKSKIKVLVHFYDTNFPPSVLKMLIKYQNHIQDLFEFKISEWETFFLKVIKESSVQGFIENLTPKEGEKETDLLLTTVNEIINSIQELPQSEKFTDCINLVLTSQISLRSYYAWNTKDRNGIVISIGRILEVFKTKDSHKIDLMIIRVIQRMLIYSQRIPNLKGHDNNKHCVMHMSRYIPDLEQSIMVNYLCKNCRSIILNSDEGEFYLEKINQWMDSAILLE